MKPSRRLAMMAAACLALMLAGCQRVHPAPSPVVYADPGALYRLISEQAEPYILIDVRTNDEYVAGHIPTAKNIPYDTIAENAPTADRKALIIVYCASGRRSALAKKTLDGLGFTNVVDFGGVSRWKGDSIAGGDPGECPCRQYEELKAEAAQ